MGKKNEKEKIINSRICKVVYFDEESVTDYIQIISGGKLEKTTELLNQTTDTGNAGVETKAAIGIGGVLKALMGFEVSASTEASLDTSFNTDRMAKNIVKNTILTDFIDILAQDASDTQYSVKGAIHKFDGYTVTAPKDSLSYIALISPYLAMLRSGAGIQAGEFNIAIDKLDNTIKAAKGYYEFVGKKDDDTVIFRFNIKSFKNNYKVTDLLKMDISIYAIKVGTSTLDKLNFNNEFEIKNMTKNNPTYSKSKCKEVATSEGSAKPLDVYDVMLAGVEVHD